MDDEFLSAPLLGVLRLFAATLVDDRRTNGDLLRFLLLDDSSSSFEDDVVIICFCRVD